MVHALLFFVMAFLSYRSLRVSSRIRWALPLTAAAVVAYSALLELLQTLTVARQPELGDLAANALGVLLFTLAVMLVGRRRR